MKSCVISGFLTAILLTLGCDRSTRNPVQTSANLDSTTPPTHVLVRKPWHEIEGLQIEPVSLPSVSLDQISGIKSGDSLADIELACGFKPFKFYLGTDFRILHAQANSGDRYEVAFLIRDESRIEDISYRRMIRGKADSQHD